MLYLFLFWGHLKQHRYAFHVHNQIFRLTAHIENVFITSFELHFFCVIFMLKKTQIYIHNGKKIDPIVSLGSPAMS